MLKAPLNVNGRPNSDVVRSMDHGSRYNQMRREMWIIDFGSTERWQKLPIYELPFSHVEKHVKPVRLENRMPTTAREVVDTPSPRRRDA